MIVLILLKSSCTLLYFKPKTATILESFCKDWLVKHVTLDFVLSTVS